MNRRDRPDRFDSLFHMRPAIAPFHHWPIRLALSAVLLNAAVASPLRAEEETHAASEAQTGSPNAAAVPAEAAEDISALLPLLLTTPERRQLIGEVEAALREGDVKSAERHLNNIVEMGTFAIILIDRLHDPKLLSSLQALGIGGDADGSAAQQAAASDTAGMQKTLDQAEARSEALARDLAALNEDHRRLQHLRAQDVGSSNARVAELQSAVQRERTQREAMLRDLAETRDALAALQAERSRAARSHASGLAELQDALTREQVRNDTVMRELADVMEELRALQESRQAGPIPSIYQLETAGIPAPTGAVPATGFAQAAPVLGTGALPLPPDQGAGTRAAAAAPQGRAGSAPAPAAEPPAASPDDRLLARADALLRAGDVSGARLLLERLLASGNARAAFLLAETFDPQVLTNLGVVGIRGDQDKAREFYARARALGIRQADERLQALR